MESYIQISFLNDFIFCPKSIYFHQLHGELNTRLYHAKPQIDGLAAHSAIDQQQYSSKSSILQGIEIYSEKYNLCGKIDVYDYETKTLTERKKKITTIYDGYIFQLFAQYFCLIEMGYQVDYLKLYSYDTNKNCPVLLPKDNPVMLEKFNQLIVDLNDFNITNFKQTNLEKCKNCIYLNLCDQELC